MHSHKQNEFGEKLLSLNFLLDDWIDNNIPGYGDGWSSYTISLRIRNWIIIFRTLPRLVNENLLIHFGNRYVGFLTIKKFI